MPLFSLNIKKLQYRFYKFSPRITAFLEQTALQSATSICERLSLQLTVPFEAATINSPVKLSVARKQDVSCKGTADLQGGPVTSYNDSYNSTYRDYNLSYLFIRPFI